MAASSLVLFDLDDTLVQTAQMVRHARLQTVSYLGLVDVESALDAWRRLSRYFVDGRDMTLLAALKDEMAGRMPSAQTDLDGALQEYNDRFWDDLRPTVGAEEVLSYLKGAGLHIGIMSNGDNQRQTRKLEVTGLTKYFDPEHIRIHAPASRLAKPHPDGLLELFNSVGISADEAIMVGDRLGDVVAARLAGVGLVVRYAAESSEPCEPEEAILALERPDVVISSLAELIDVISI